MSAKLGLNKNHSQSRCANAEEAMKRRNRTVMLVLCAALLAVAGTCERAMSVEYDSDTNWQKGQESPGDVPVVVVTAERLDKVVPEVVVTAEAPELLMPEVVVRASRPRISDLSVGIEPDPNNIRVD